MRPASWQRAVTGLVGVASAIVAMGCNAILGNDEGTLRPTTSTATSTSSATASTTSAGGAGGGTGSATGGTAGASGSGTGGTVGTGGSGDGGVDASDDQSMQSDATPIGDATPTSDAPPTPDGGGCNPTLPPTCAGRAQKTVLTCDTGSRTLVSTSCPGAKLCDASSGPNQGTCQDPVPACAGKMPGDKFCMGKDSVTCGPDLVTSTTDTCPFTCIGAGQCAACTPGTKQCMGNGYQTCQANGTWSAATACPSACIGAGECGACTPNEKGCSGNGSQTCQANGSWGTATACQYVCTGSGMCTGECAPGAKKCSGNGVQTCGSNGLYGTANPCMYVCTGSGVCGGECTPGSKRCSGNGVQTCGSDGMWAAAVACQYVCTGQGVCGGMCSPGAKQCMGTGFQTCQGDGTWSGTAACPYVCTGAGACTGMCTPGSKQCSGNGVQTCQSDGTYGAAVACPFVCTGVGTCTGVCTPGAKQCSGNGVQTCQSNGTWGAAAGCPFTCTGQGVCGGMCVPGTTQCSGNGVRTCQAGGTLSGIVPCGSTVPVCSNGVCGQPPSCTPALGGCGSGETCCASTVVPGGTFNRANDATVPATVSDFRMDNYEVTVGRFRKFFAAYPGNKPAQGAGKNPNNTSDLGWDTNWNGQMPDATTVRSALNSNEHTWTDTAGSNENRPINNVTWYLAQAFCIWDGGRLATEAEWNYAAAGGNQQRVYPWSNPPTDETISNSYLSFYDGSGCLADGAQSCTAADLLAVGSKPMGRGRWGQWDLAGNAAEWTSDYFYSLQTPCINCSNPMGASGSRFHMGGAYNTSDYECATTYLASYDSPLGYGSYGIRCVRLP